MTNAAEYCLIFALGLFSLAGCGSALIFAINPAKDKSRLNAAESPLSISDTSAVRKF